MEPHVATLYRETALPDYIDDERNRKNFTFCLSAEMDFHCLAWPKKCECNLKYMFRACVYIGVYMFESGEETA